jgi:prolipoprotein diacylglyceryltransferase
MGSSAQTAVLGADGKPFHPAFLYESPWCVGVAALVIWADRRFTLGHGRAFALYVAAYAVGRFWIEALRTDPAHHILGMRLNDWTAILVFLGAVAYFSLSAKRHPGRETSPYLDRSQQAAMPSPPTPPDVVTDPSAVRTSWCSR